MSRPEIFSRAAAHSLDELDATSVTRLIDFVVASVGQHGDSTAHAVVAGHRMLAAANDKW